jgi:uncharacterized protein (TIGR02145 family)
MKKFVVFIVILMVYYHVSAQVGINSDNSAPDPSAMLDVKSASKGLLAPRVELTAINSAAPVSSPAIGLLVYNTVNTGATPNNVIPGYYCWSGTNWIAVLDPQGANPGDMQYWNGSQWVLIPAGTYGQQLFFCNGIPTWGGCPPVLTTVPVNNITYNSAVSGGNIALDGGTAIVARGVCWSTTPNPTINDSKTTDGTGTGSFVSNITGLSPNTHYYLRCYATNSAGTAYGNELSLQTLCSSYFLVSISISANANPVCSGSVVTFTASPSNGGSMPVYQWKVNNINVGQNTPVFSYTPVNNDLVTCVLTSGLECTINNPDTSNAVLMTVNTVPMPAGPINGIANWCYGSVFIPETSYWISPISNATNYVWSVPYGTVIISGLGTRSLITNAPPGMGLFSVYGTNQCGSGTPSYLSVSMVFPPNPTLTGPVNVCTYSTGNTYSTESGMNNYSWTISSGGTITSGGTSTSNTVVVTWNTSGAKTVKVNYKNAGGCWAASPSVLNVTVNPVPAAPSAGTQTASQTQIIWDWNTVTGAVGYKWNSSDDYSTATDLGTVTTKTETGLICNTSYTRYVWAYNICGYSAPVTFNHTTSACMGLPCTGTPTVSHGGQTYNTVQIGTQCWFKENLNIGTMINGSQNQTNNSVIEKYCYNNNESNCAVYGGVYQWNEMMQYVTTEGTQGICPTGWHIPAHVEWTTVTTFLGGFSVAGGKMKTTGTIQVGTGLWNDPNFGATNESGFSAVPAGFRSYGSPQFQSIGYYEYWWSSTEDNTNFAWNWHIYSNNSIAGFTQNDMKNYGFSVRCLRDY